MATAFEIVVVSSDFGSRRHLAEILSRLGLDPVCVSTLREARECLMQRTVGLLFCDPRVSDGDYEDLLAGFTGRKPRLVVTSRSADWPEFNQAMERGAFDVIAAPCRQKDVEWMVIQARRDQRSIDKHGPARLESVKTASASTT